MIFFLLFWIILGYGIYFLFSPKRPPITEEELNGLSLSTPAMIFVGLLLVAYNFFLYETTHTVDEIMGLGFGLFSLIAFGSALLVLPKRKRTPLTYFLVATGIVSGLSFAFRSNEIVLTFNAAISWLSFMVLWWIYTLSHVRWEGLWILPRLRDFLLNGLRHLMVFLKGLFQLKNRSRSQAMQVFKIVLLTFIALIFFTGLLMKADPIFESLVQDIQEEAVERLFVSLFIGAAALLGLTFKLKTDQDEASSFSWLGFYELVIPIVAVELLFGSFLGVQARYLFGSHADLSTFDLTYSEYVRKGFLELLTTTFFASILSYLLILKEKASSVTAEKRALQILNVVLIGLLVALLASALKRDLMYLEVYGLTRIRFIGMVLLTWLGGWLALLFTVNTFRRIQEKHLWMGLLALTLASFIGLNAFNIDRHIAITPPPAENAVDYFYSANLSPDAIEAWPNLIIMMAVEFESIRTITEPDDATRARLAEIKLAIKALIHQRDALISQFVADEEEDEDPTYDYDYEYYDGGYYQPGERAREAELHWTSWNWSQWTAYQLIQKDDVAVFYGTLECLDREIVDYQLSTLTDLYKEEYARLYDYQYPLLTQHNSHPRSFSELVQKSPLYDEAYALFGTSYPEPSDFLNGDPDFLARFKAAHTVESCRIPSTES